MSTTAGDQINAALRLIGQLAEGETPSAATSQDALAALNQMLDSWSIERLSVYSTQDQVFTWPANTATRTLGPTGNFVGTRPVLLDDSTYFRDTESGVSFGIAMINQQQYNGIALKTVGSTYPQVMFTNMTYPDITMTVYPVPSKASGVAHHQRAGTVAARAVEHHAVVPAGLPAVLQVQPSLRDRGRVRRRGPAHGATHRHVVQAQSQAHQQPG
jgi:hypothetical protein